MHSHKAAIIRDGAFRLGQSRVNVDQFLQRELLEIPINLEEESRLPKSPIINGCTKELVDKYFLPPIFGKLVEGERKEVEGIVSGKRAMCFPDRKVDLQLQTFGWSEEPATQEFVVDVKGCGLRLLRSEVVSQHEVEQIARKHGLELDKRFPDSLIFSLNGYRVFDTPEGAQGECSALESIDSTEYFTGKSPVKLKIAPTFQMVYYTEKVQDVAEELGGKGNDYEGYLVQEKRLLPSLVRATYLQHNPGKSVELARMVGGDLEKVVSTYIKDAADYFDVLVKTTVKKPSGKIAWTNVGYTASVFEEPNNMLEKPYAWYLAKDIVLASSGMYFVDGECIHRNNTVSSARDMKKHHELYLITLFKDFFHTIALYKAGASGVTNEEGIKSIEQDVRTRLIDELNRRGNFKASQNRSGIDIKVMYQNVRSQKYSIKSKYLPRVA